MIAGARYARDDAEMLMLLEKPRLLFRSGSAGGGIGGAFPILTKIAPVFSGYALMMSTTSDLQEFFRVSIGISNFTVTFKFSHNRIWNLRTANKKYWLWILRHFTHSHLISLSVVLVITFHVSINDLIDPFSTESRKISQLLRTSKNHSRFKNVSWVTWTQ